MIKNIKFPLVLLMLGVAITGYAQLNPSSLEPELKPNAMAVMSLNEMDHDFGEIEKGIPVSHTFEFINEGDAPLIISRVKTSCGCTASDYSKEPVLPGETGTLKATYNAAKVGSFNKTVTVVSNVGEELLSIKGIVIDQ